MSNRRYTPKVRQTQVFERKQRVAAATAELHAEKGVSATSYADIAGRAGVSLPTVYSYFPTQADLLSACTGHVVARAPHIPVQAILATPDLSDAAVWESILSFDFWQRLVHQHGLTRARVRKILKNLLMAALGPGLSTSIQPGPRRKS